MLFFTQCFGITLDLCHLRFRHCKARRVFSAAGQLVCVVHPTHSHKGVPAVYGASHTSIEKQKTDTFHSQNQQTSIQCLWLSCNWEGSLEAVVPHVSQSHRVTIFQGAEVVLMATDIHFTEAEDWTIVQSCHGHHFLLVLRKQEKHEGHIQFFATVMLVGTPCQAENFTYRLELSRNKRRLKWEATPRSVLEGVDSIIRDNDGLVFNESLAYLFSDNGILALSVTVSTGKHSVQNDS
ncbi:seven in absentia homolog 3 [Protopterus annectens]|uniref:seven in absentia homolog 3 n=1 Tax=Protopterus annectens TaxID=7888 RepID=UPI001CFC3D37|nr:seven in absentia homolog 3 [Protopterus annectens]